MDSQEKVVNELTGGKDNEKEQENQENEKNETEEGDILRHPPIKKSSSLGDASRFLEERRGSKVRFSHNDLQRKESRDTDEDDEDEAEDSFSETLQNNSAIARAIAKTARRGSLGGRRGSVDPSEGDSLQKYHPRKRVSSAFQSLDYNAVESQRFLQDQESMKPQAIQQAAVMRWVVNFTIGLYVAIIAILVALAITYISKLKFMAIYEVVKDCNTVGCIIPGLIIWIVINMFLVFIGSYLVTFHAPHAAGSGIPQIKCYLNGIKLPGLLSLKTLLAKAGGVVLSVCGGLACGKEGPMIHSGAICASGMARSEFHLCGKTCKPECCEALRTDEERRDFVAAGAASGVSAAFASPVGGVLFSLEEGASFLKQMLTWRMLFSSMTASLFLNIMMSAIKGHPEDMSSPGLISFGYIGDISFKTFEIPIFMVMACVGGISGAIFVQINYKLTLFRRRVVTSKWMKVGESVFVAFASAVILFVMIYAVPDCKPIRDFNATLYCNPNYTAPEEMYHIDLDPPRSAHSNKKRSADDLGVQVPVLENVTLTPEEIRTVVAEGRVTTASHVTTQGHVEIGHEEEKDKDHGSAKEKDKDHGSAKEKDKGHGSVKGDDDDDHELDSHGQGHGHDPYGFHGHGYTFKGFCPCGEHNRMADILFKTPEGGLHAMLHQPYDEWSFMPLVLLLIVYHLLATWTYGLMVSSGVFIPSLLIGALWGRIIGMVVIDYIPGVGTNMAKYALIGAACNLGGTVRMTISLTVIVIECTGDITFGIPIMLSLIIAKWMGDFFNPGIYDIHIEIMGVPLLPWDPPEMTNAIKAREVMSSPVECLQCQEKVGRIVKILNDPNSHNGFPIVDDYDPESSKGNVHGRLKGFMLRSQLEQLVMAEGTEVREDEYDSVIDLRMHMDRAPFCIHEEVSLPRVFRLFRGLGLRHLVVVNDRNRVTGIITRINLARFRGEIHKGHFKLEELEVLEN